MKRKRIKKILLWNLAVVLVLALATLVGASLYMLDYALATNKRSHQEAMERFYKREPGNMKPWVDSLQDNHCLHDTSLMIDGRGTMRAIYITAAKPTNKVAVLVHGYKDRAESMLHIAHIYNYHLGYNVLLPHLHAHGDSDGDNIDMGWLDRLDIMEWMNLADSMFRGDSTATQMVVHGISMGGATTMCVSGEACPPYVKCFVEDCGYTSVWDEFSGELRNQFDLPEFPIMHLTSALCKMRYGWSFGEASALKQVKKSTLPMLFIHGDADTFVPYSMLDKLYNAKQKGYKEKYVTHGTEHARSFSEHQAEYTQRVETFVNRFIK